MIESFFLICFYIEGKMSPDKGSKKIIQPLSPNAKGRGNEALKMVNSRVRPGRSQVLQKVDITTAAPRPAKPRQLSIQPKTVQKGSIYFFNNSLQ